MKKDVMRFGGYFTMGLIPMLIFLGLVQGVFYLIENYPKQLELIIGNLITAILAVILTAMFGWIVDQYIKDGKKKKRIKKEIEIEEAKWAKEHPTQSAMK